MKYYFIAPEYRETITTLKLDHPKNWMNFSVQDIVMDRTSETRRLAPPSPLPGCYAKIYRYPRRDDRLRILLRGGLLGRSRGKVEHDNLQRLHAKGLAPRIIAFGQERSGGLLSASLLVVEEVVGALPMDTFIFQKLPSMSKSQRKIFIKTLAIFTRKMNQNRFVNSEYHWRNILVRQTDDTFSIQVIDPSSSRRRYGLIYPFFDLVTLDVCAPFFFTRTERLRFFKLYENSSDSPLTVPQKKKLRKIITLRKTVAKKELKRHKKILPDDIHC